MEKKKEQVYHSSETWKRCLEKLSPTTSLTGSLLVSGIGLDFTYCAMLPSWNIQKENVKIYNFFQDK